MRMPKPFKIGCEIFEKIMIFLYYLDISVISIVFIRADLHSE